MALDFKTRIARLRLKQKDIAADISDDRITVDAPLLNRVANGTAPRNARSDAVAVRLDRYLSLKEEERGITS